MRFFSATWAFGAVLSIEMLGCSDPDCSGPAMSSLNVIVSSPEGSICNATVIADGNGQHYDLAVQDYLDDDSGPHCSYNAFSGPGTYAITASRPGFRTVTAMLTIRSGECGPVG